LNEMGLSGGMVYGALGYQVLITSALVLLTSRKKSVICKWINTVYFVREIVMIMFSPDLAMLGVMGIVQSLGVMGIVQLIMQSYGIYFLFNADSKAWFESKA